MDGVIRIYREVLNELIKHCNIDREVECGGYLYGNYKKGKDSHAITINAIYSEEIFGTENKFNFPLSYEFRAKEYGKQIGRELIGCYHSHGNYPAIFSHQDRILETHYMNNNTALIYSPIEDKLIGDIITTEGIVYSSRIIIIDSQNLDKLYNPKLQSTSCKVMSLKKLRK